MKKTLKKALPFALMVLMVFSLMVGCSSGPTSTESAPAAVTTQATETASVPTTTPAVSVEPTVIKISMATTNTDTKALVLADFAKEVEQATGGAIKFEMYYSNELGTLQDITEQMTMGANILTGSSGDFYASYGCPDIMGSALFYVFPTKEDVQKLNDSDLFKSWCDKIEQSSNLKILCCNWSAAPRSVLSTEPINSIEDFNGLKIRVPGKAADAFFSELDAATMTMAFSDIYTSMQQKMVDAAEAPLSTLYNYSLQEVAKYCYLSEHSLAPNIWAMSADVWNSITPENQQILQNALVEYGAIFSQKGLDAQSEFRNKLEDAGVTFIEPSAEDKAKLQEAGAAAFNAFPDMTPGLADEITKIISEKQN